MWCGGVKVSIRRRALASDAVKWDVGRRRAIHLENRAEGRMRISARPWLYLVLGVWAAASLAETAAALDVPIDAALLRLSDTASGTSILFLSRDPDVPFPAPGSGEDPSTQSGHLSVDLFTSDSSPDHVDLPTGLGTPGWRFVDAKIDRWVFANRNAPDALSSLGLAMIQEARVLKLAGFIPGLSLGGPIGASVVRIQNGANRVCAAFLPGDVRRDEPARFVARHAAAASLDDCSDPAILEAL